MFGSWLSCFGWLGAGLRDDCGDCLCSGNSVGELLVGGGMRGRRSGVEVSALMSWVIGLVSGCFGMAGKLSVRE